MDSKLTLKLNENVVRKAKNYALNRKISLSRLIENYLDSITEKQNDDFEISPFVKSISNGNSLPENTDWKVLREDYTNYLDQKYQ
jgi:hypothetical protein